jgi:hypothetical protein
MTPLEIRKHVASHAGWGGMYERDGQLYGEHPLCDREQAIPTYEKNTDAINEVVLTQIPTHYIGVYLRRLAEKTKDSRIPHADHFASPLHRCEAFLETCQAISQEKRSLTATSRPPMPPVSAT